MNYRKFCNYLTAIVNAENARQNNHDNETSATFEQNRIWALNHLKEIFHDEDNKTIVEILLRCSKEALLQKKPLLE